jgi:mono/diheme cytochrome c family protein
MASPHPDPLRDFDRGFAPFVWLVAAFAVVVLFAGPELIGAKKDVPVVKAAAPAATPAGTATGDGTATATAAPAAVAGETVFASAGCGGCHTLAAANASGSIGPNLDDLKPSADTVKAKVAAGGAGMPSFSGQLSEAEIAAVADYVASSAGG